MSREIKYRAFVTEFSEMVNVEYLHIESEEVEVYLNHRGFGTRLFSYSESTPDALVAQYTGLTDKNEVEIYKGDIVKFKDLDDEIHEIEFIGVVEFENCSFLLNVGDVLKCYRWIDYYDYEVIGNIHENPELLGDAK